MRLLEENDAFGATTVFEQLSVAEPENGRVYLYLGIARSKAGDFEGGVAALRRAAQLLPDQAAVWFNLGVGLTKLREMGAAQKALENALTIDPSHANAREALRTIDPRSRLLLSGGDQGPVRVASAPIGYAADVSSGQAGGRYTPTVAPALNGGFGQLTMGRRLARGAGWGFVCGQYWTMLKMLWYFVWGGGSNGVAYSIGYAVAFLFVCGIVGSVAGVAIAARPANAAKCATIGGIAGLAGFFFEFFAYDGASITMLLDTIFWFFTGQYVGVNIAKRVYASTLSTRR